MLKKHGISLLIILILLITITVFAYANTVYAKMIESKKLNFETVQVLANILNIRVGPGTEYDIIAQTFKGDILKVYAEVNGWYIIQTIDNYFGLIKSEFVKRYNGKIPDESTGLNKKDTENIQKKEQDLFLLINKERKKSGLKALKLDGNLTKIARLKAKEMVEKNYFSNKSPKYGTPFDMLKNNNIKYKTAGENIAGSADIEQTFKAWMKVDSHKKNLLNKNYNYTGIGIAVSKDYGFIIVAEFIGR